MHRSLRSGLTLIFAAAALLAQTEKATVRGIVTDSTGAVVPGAVITVSEIATNLDRKTSSDTNGNFEVPNLQPGAYSVKADRVGFRSFVAPRVLLASGEVRRVNIRLQIG